MADLAYPVAIAPPPGAVQGRAPERHLATIRLGVPGRLLRDFRHLVTTSGTISDVVVLKTSGGEVPFADGRVWLMRLADGFKAWEGWTDAAGAYTATGLELGVEYVAVGIDPLRNHKATGAGPVLAA